MLTRKPEENENKNANQSLVEKLTEMARNQGVKPLESISELQASEIVDDPKIEQEISDQRIRQRVKNRSS